MRNSRPLRLIGTLTLTWALVASASADDALSRKLKDGHTKAIEYLTRALRNFVNDTPVPGMSVAVAIDGKIVWSEGFGYADLEQRIPATPSTVYRIASISKSMTGAVAARMWHDGRLDLDAPIRDYLPEFPEKEKGTITVRHLLGHQSGIRHYADDQEKFSLVHYDSLVDALSMFSDSPLLFAPGEQMSYTTLGYTVLGAVMEKASGMKFIDLMQKELFGPVGMRHTVADENTRLIPNRSGTYSYDPGLGVHNAPPTNHSYKIPGGGLLSTAEDVAMFGAAIAEPGVLDAATIAEMMKPMKNNSGQEYDYAMGWALDFVDGRVQWNHGGNQPGARSFLLVYPEENVSVAILANIDGAPISRPEAAMIAEPFLEFLDGAVAAAPSFDPTGTYEFTTFNGEPAPDGGATLEIRRKLNGLAGLLSFGAQRLDVYSVMVEGRRARMFGFNGERLMSVELVVGPDGTATATVRAGGSRFVFTGTHTPFPGSADGDGRKAA